MPNDKLISWREIDNETVFLHKEEKAFYELNNTANLVWKKAVERRKVKEIIDAVGKKYKNVNKWVLKKDIVNFISDLLDKKIFLLGNE